MLSVNCDPAQYAEQFTRLQITKTCFLAFRDIPDLIKKYVSGTKTLDYGCGSGRSPSFLKSLGLDVVGVDISEEMINRAKIVCPEVEYHLIESGEIPAPDESFDFVFDSWVLIKVGSKEELKKIVREIARVLKPSGTYITVACSEDNYNTDWISINTEFEENKNLHSGSIVKAWFKDLNLGLDHYFWSDKDYREVISSAGLRLVETHRPLGKPDDGYGWNTEKIKSPWAIYVAKKV